MAWYDRLLGRAEEIEVEEKLNPSQQYYDHQTAPSREYTLKYEKAYEDIEIVNRGVNLIVDDASEIKTTVGEQIQGLQNIVKGVKRIIFDVNYFGGFIVYCFIKSKFFNISCFTCMNIYFIRRKMV